MPQVDNPEPIATLTEQIKTTFRPPAMLLQSAGSGLSKSYSEVAACSAAFMRENIDELSRCTADMLAARDPLGMVACYSSFLLRWEQRSATQATEVARIMARAVTGLFTAEVDGSRPSVSDGAWADRIEPAPAAH